jgi:hypothetical protein
MFACFETTDGFNSFQYLSFTSVSRGYAGLSDCLVVVTADVPAVVLSVDAAVLFDAPLLPQPVKPDVSMKTTNMQ